MSSLRQLIKNYGESGLSNEPVGPQCSIDELTSSCPAVVEAVEIAWAEPQASKVSLE